MQNIRLDNLIYNQSDSLKLNEALELVKPRLTIGSLAAYDGFDFAELYRFMQIFRHLNETVTGSELFSGQILSPAKNHVFLPNNIYELLV